MMKLIVTLSLLISMLGSFGCGTQFSDGSDSQNIESTIGATIDATISAQGTTDSPDQSNDSHDSDVPCGDCHLHGHCHCVFLKTDSKLSSFSLETSQPMTRDNFAPDPYLNNIFRPPIA